MRWVLITAFGVPVEPEVNRNLAMVSGPTAAKAFATASLSGVAAIDRNEIAAPPSASPVTMTARVQRLDRRQRRRERFCAGHVDRAGIEQPDHAPELVEIPRHQRIGRRDRRRRHAGMHRRQREQRVIDAVVGENHQRTLRAQALRQNPAGHRAHLPQRVAVGDRRPRRVGLGALAEKNLLRRLPRPMLQPVADAARMRLAAARWISARWCRRRGGRPRSRASRTACRNSRGWRRRLVSSVSSGGPLYRGWQFALRENRACRQDRSRTSQMALLMK